MKLSLGFRRVINSDVDFLLQLRKATMTEHLANAGYSFSDEDHMNRIKEFFKDSFIILNHQESIGLIKLGVFAERIHIRQFQITPQLQNRGVGSYVLDIVKKKAKELNLPITLYVLLNNPAKTLYIKHGFVVEEHTESEYQMRWDMQ